MNWGVTVEICVQVSYVKSILESKIHNKKYILSTFLPITLKLIGSIESKGFMPIKYWVLNNAQSHVG